MNDESNAIAEDVKPEGEQIDEVENADGQDGIGELSESESIKKRLGQQQKKHKREMRAVQDQLAQQSMVISQMQQQLSQNAPMNDQSQQNQPAIQPNNVDPRHLMEMQKIQDEFHQDLQKTSQKYDDFDDIVQDPYAPFTESIKHIAMTLDNPGEVIYSLAKNRDELYRIKDLPPHRQAKELNKLSKALSLKEKTASGTMQAKPMTPLKGDASTLKGSNNPTSVADFRRMLRSGGRK